MVFIKIILSSFLLMIKITGITSDFNQSIEQSLIDFGINDTLKLDLKYQFQMRQWLVDVTITTNKSVDRYFELV